MSTIDEAVPLGGWDEWLGAAGGGVVERRLGVVPATGGAILPAERDRLVPLAVKRAVDVVVATVVLLLTLPVILVAALAVKLQDGGPVFYRQERVGRNGERFRLLKLRTMVPRADEYKGEVWARNNRVGGPLFKLANDPRVTRVGRFLRASSIDELPQLLNVLQGSMSMVGPRPALPAEVAQFDDELLARLTVRPGITGLWQVVARDDPSFDSYRRLDLFYLEHRSLILDMVILVSTVGPVLSRAVHALSRRSRIDDQPLIILD